MDDQAQQTALLSALATEHFVLQTATSTSVNESASRATLYLMSLSSALVAMGFVVQTRDAFAPFVATVLPALFVMGVFTVLRLVDNAVENLQFLAGMARIRSYYRTLAPDAAVYFPPEGGRWPEPTSLAQGRGPFPLMFTSASMIAFVDSVVAGAGVALLVSELAGDDGTGVGVLVGVAVALGLMTGFLVFQRWRYRTLEASPLMS